VAASVGGDTLVICTSSEAAPRKQLRVLHVEDSEDDSALVVILTSGEEALARIRSSERFDAIVSDLMMLEVTGMELHDELSRIAPDQAKSMIFLTGGAFSEMARDFLAGVRNPRLEKPFEVTKILHLIANAPRR
jgi:CheY-like chemotaxis protein